MPFLACIAPFDGKPLPSFRRRRCKCDFGHGRKRSRSSCVSSMKERRDHFERLCICLMLIDHVNEAVPSPQTTVVPHHLEYRQTPLSECILLSISICPVAMTMLPRSRPWRSSPCPTGCGLKLVRGCIFQSLSSQRKVHHTV